MAELSTYANLDLDRAARRGYPEAIYCAGKTPAQVAGIANALRSRPDAVTLFTRASPEHAAAVLSALPDARHDTEASLLAWPPTPPPPSGGEVLVLAAGTSDLPYAREALLTARYLGRPATLVVDVGVAGLHRVLARIDQLREARAIVVAAGMDGALPSVVAGLVSAPVIALPTSVGYGAAFEGLAALLAMLNACAPGVAVVNIDNGFGAGHLAAQIAAPHQIPTRQTTTAQDPAPETATPQNGTPHRPTPQHPAPQIPGSQPPASQHGTPDLLTSRTTAPQTTAPQTTAPETATPRLSVPQTPTPHHPKPQVPIPQTAAPQTPAPELPVPQTGTPHRPTPQVLAAQTPAPPNGTPELPALQPTASHHPEPQIPDPQNGIGNSRAVGRRLADRLAAPPGVASRRPAEAGGAGPGAGVSGRHAWIDVSAGVAGDMLLGALLDAGAQLDAVRRDVDAVLPGAVSLDTTAVSRAGLRALKADVRPLVADPPHRTWRHIRALLDDAAIPEAVRRDAVAVFARLAAAEAQVHGVPADDVHFHEVGALDSIADVVGVCAALNNLGVTSVSAGEVALGAGRVRTAHGELPVPAPAVLELSRGWRVSAGGSGELATPTGMAALRALATGCEDLPPMTVEAIGVGAGGRDTPGRANTVRVIIGTTAQAAALPVAPAVVLEANVDDLDPRLWPGVLDGLLHAGASDAWLVPILMKKGRPAHTLTVLCAPDRRDALRTRIFRDTSTLGVRESRRDKTALPRTFRGVEVAGGTVAVKIGHAGGIITQVMPEFEDVAALARQTGRAERVVLQEALAAAAAAGLTVGAPGPEETDQRTR